MYEGTKERKHSVESRDPERGAFPGPAVRTALGAKCSSLRRKTRAPSASGTPFEVAAAATARLLKHHTRSGAWVEITPGLKVPHTHSTQHTQALLQHTHRMVAHRLRLAGRMAGVSGSSLGDPAPQRTASQ